jgi:hypothetical protein
MHRRLVRRILHAPVRRCHADQVRRTNPSQSHTPGFWQARSTTLGSLNSLGTAQPGTRGGLRVGAEPVQRRAGVRRVRVCGANLWRRLGARSSYEPPHSSYYVLSQRTPRCVIAGWAARFRPSSSTSRSSTARTGPSSCGRFAAHRTQQKRIVTFRDFGRSLTRPLQFLYTTPADFPPHKCSPYRGLRVRRGVWDFPIIQGPFSFAPCQTLTLRFATFSSV